MNVLDPCKVLCSISMDDCKGVSEVDGMCNNLYLDDDLKLTVSSSSGPGYLQISAKNALDTVAVSAHECSTMCHSTPECAASYCKPNNHCHGMFWDNLTDKKACFHTSHTPCKHDQPLMCKYSEKAHSTTVAPESGSIAAARTASVESSRTARTSDELVDAPDLEDADANTDEVSSLSDDSSNDEVHQQNGGSVQQRANPQTTVMAPQLVAVTTVSPVTTVNGTGVGTQLNAANGDPKGINRSAVTTTLACVTFVMTMTFL